MFVCLALLALPVSLKQHEVRLAKRWSLLLSKVAWWRAGSRTFCRTRFWSGLVWSGILEAAGDSDSGSNYRCSPGSNASSESSVMSFESRGGGKVPACLPAYPHWTK